MHPIFTYGSLRKGYGNHALLEDGRFGKVVDAGDCITEGKYTLLHLGGFPGLVAKGNTSVYGELYNVDDDVLRRLDQLEGHPHFYKRVPLKVKPVGTQEDTPWQDVEGYVLPEEWLDDRAKVIESGDWRKA